MGITFLVKTMGEITEDNLRGQNNQKVNLITPKGKINPPPITFKWSSSAQAEVSLKYQVELLDKELTEVWLSEKINKTYITLPDIILKKMKKDDIYFWKVISFLKCPQSFHHCYIKPMEYI